MTEHTANSETQSRALVIYDEDVPPTDVARGYLQVELGNVFGENLRSDAGSIDESLETLSVSQVNRLLEAVSYTYRMNGTFHKVTDASLDWMDVELPLDAILLTKIKPHISEIVYSSDIQRSPIAFAAFLGEYFSHHPDLADDPQDLNEFRPRSLAGNATSLITSESDGVIEVFDGNHRLTNAALLGAVSVRVFAGIPNGRESISMKGDSVFLTLRLEYEKAESSEERVHILETCLLLAKSSTDGRDAIHSYWVEHALTEEVASEGKVMLARLGQG
ncbi:MAG: hypothetical protein JWO07_540 [Candidatus Saccharibacteria bacterium]|nr:hypothetical protein [Candidatus Saccharibacteria bacterium]